MSTKEKIIASNPTDSQIALFYLGQVGFILKFRGKYILIDGYLSDYVDKNCCSDSVKWVRKYPSPIDGSELDFIDLVLCTHTHFDHTDPYTVKKIARVNNKAKFLISSAVSDVLVSYGVKAENIVKVAADNQYRFDDIIIKPIPSAHEALNQNEKGEFFELGFILTLGDITVYHSGDCCMYDGLEERIKETDIAIMPINGRDYFRNKNDIIGCFDSVEALTLAKNANIKLLIPVHFDLYEVNEVNPAYFADCHTKICPFMPYHIFMPGEKYLYEK